MNPHLRMRRSTALIGLAVIFFPIAALAQTLGETITLGAGETHDDNFVAFGNLIEVAGTVKGDVIVAGNEVKVTGKVDGDVLAVGSNVTVSGDVGGNVRVAGGSVELTSKVGKNVTIAAESLTLGPEVTVGGSLAFAARTADLAGMVGRTLWAAGEQITVRSTVDRNATVFLGDEGRLILGSEAHLKANLRYTARNELTKDPGAAVDGVITRKEPVRGGTSVFQTVYGRLLAAFNVLLIGIILLSLKRQSLKNLTQPLRERLRPTFGWGLVAFILVPAVAILLLVTYVGVQLAALVGLLYVAGLIFAQVLVGYAVGDRLLVLLRRRRASKTEPAPAVKESSPFLALILGVVVLEAVMLVPILEIFVRLVTLVLGLGILLQLTRSLFRKPSEPNAHA